MDQRARDVLQIGNKLFSDRGTVHSLWQELALQFYPERADFTTKRTDGDEFAEHLFSSYPVLARRELGNLLASALRPRSDKWFSIHVDDDDLDKGDAERKFLEEVRDTQWRAMYDASAGFVRATKQGDHDFATFGNCVIKGGLNIAGDGLLYRNYHLRDNAWSENAEGIIDCNHRNWELTARQLVHHFGDKCSPNVQKCAKKDPEKPFTGRHVVMPSRLYDYKNESGRRFPFVSLYVECESETVLEEVGLNYFCYVIPRWMTVANSSIGVSMATSVILPDGRTMQVVIRTLRETAEKHADPPMVAVTDAIRGDIALYPGGVTTADIEYDERLGEVLRPLTRDKAGFPIGAEIAAALREDIRAGFFLDKIQLPEAGKDMTAFEVRRRLEEHIRQASPIFEPIEQEYNDPLCELSFNILRDGGAFPLHEMPESLDGMQTHFSFRSPLADMADAREAEMYVDVRDRILAPTAAVDPAQIEQVDWDVATRDAMRAGGFKASWFKPLDAVAQRREQNAKAAAIAKGAEAIGVAGQVGEQAGKAMSAIKEAQGGGQAA